MIREGNEKDKFLLEAQIEVMQKTAQQQNELIAKLSSRLINLESEQSKLIEGLKALPKRNDNQEAPRFSESWKVSKSDQGNLTVTKSSDIAFNNISPIHPSSVFTDPEIKQKSFHHPLRSNHLHPVSTNPILLHHVRASSLASAQASEPPLSGRPDRMAAGRILPNPLSLSSHSRGHSLSLPSKKSEVKYGHKQSKSTPPFTFQLNPIRNAAPEGKKASVISKKMARKALSTPLPSKRAGPACQGCRARKRKCGRERPACSYCVRMHRFKDCVGQVECVYSTPGAKLPPLPADGQSFNAILPDSKQRFISPPNSASPLKDTFTGLPIATKSEIASS